MIIINRALKDGFRFIRTLSFSKIKNYILITLSYRISILTGRSQHMGLPVSISVEPTTSCNLRCPECPAGLRQFTRPTGSMSIDSFRNTIDQLRNRLTYLMLYFQGEPFLNKDFFEMIRFAVNSNIYTATSTNGHFLDDKNARKTVDSGLHRIIISIDGATQESYDKYRSGGDYDKVIRGLKNLVKWKKERNSATPYLIVQFLVLKTNEHEIDTIRSVARELGADKLELKSAQVYQYENDHTLIPENSKYARYKKTDKGRWVLKKPLKNQCFRMWSGAVITWDGKVVPCCFDKDAQHQFGILEEATFREIWSSKSYRLFRNQILSDRSQIDICRNCLQ